MAKWGEGDPRWIVEERPDATNVNNWHWTEKNACQWSVDKLKELLTGLKIENALAKCRITEVEKCEGEAVANNRKGKLIFFYEWELKLKWKGCLLDSKNTEIEGTAEIPNLSEEYDASEVDVDFSVKTHSVEADRLKEIIAKDARDVIRSQLAKYIKALREEFAKGMILPKKEDEQATKQDSLASLTAGFKSKVQMDSPSKEGSSKKLSTTTLTMSVKLQCRKEEVYNALTSIELVQAFTNGPVVMEVKPGGKFELFGGNIHGEFLELVPNAKICQKWRFKGWPDGHFSDVTMDIEELSDCTEVKLVQKDVPESEMDTTKENWNRYYWDAMRKTFGFGAFFV
ncbi:activator of 90 kDa heat shock protein ATPase homolog 1 [Schistocerca cancellata]|uniref:activator of 90 kDa heat shock protein ATPase homolog 1 n=1 Tax=Schistocerca cancellata TaxID=274614 RepID=UPI002117C024|nr:activator of 90 kDa heat shock protein ATPase homolog 1 [Schistocerca cancellata]